MKFRDESGPCMPHSVGTLHRRHVHAQSIEHLGKEANLLGRRIEGAGAADDAQQTYTNAPLTDREIDRLASCPPAELAAAAGITERALRDLLSRRRKPRPRTAWRYH